MTLLNSENQELSEADVLKMSNLCLQLYWNRVGAQEIGKQRTEEAPVQNDALHTFILPLLQCAGRMLEEQSCRGSSLARYFILGSI